MKLVHVAPAHGLRWIVRGWRIFVQRPLGFAVLLLAFLLALLFALLLPWIGPIVMLSLLPLVTLGFMIGTREALGGRMPMPAVFIAPLRGDPARRRALIRLCAIYAAASIAIIALCDTIDGGRLQELQSVIGSADEADTRRAAELLGDPSLRWGVTMRFVLATLLAIPFWHAPALVHWAGQGAAQSLFSSSVAILRNRGAFAVYALGWLATVGAFGLLTGLIGAALGLRQLVAMLAAPAGLLFTTVFYASLYFTFVDSFSEVS